MASGFFAILDDIAALMDDIAVTSKIATQKTAGILGDDLAVNAEKATGFISNRELPVLWAITKGSFVNKLIILPIVFLLSYFFPVAIKYILIFGGIYLAYEGAEKIVEFIFHRSHKKEALNKEDLLIDEVPDEKVKVKAAITTDFILSVEIVIIALGTVLDKNLTTQILTVSIVAIIATVGVYGIVALIVRMDDIGLSLISRSKNAPFLAHIGKFLVALLPIVIKILAIVGTFALLLVAGGIFIHNIDYFHHFLPNLPPILVEFILGISVGLIAVAFMLGTKKVISLFKNKK